MTQHIGRLGLAAIIATSTIVPLPSAAATRHRVASPHIGLHHRHSIARYGARRHAPSTYGPSGPSFVYGASAPYYVFGPGGGDAYGYDPIGGPEHVGDGGPAVNF